MLLRYTALQSTLPLLPHKFACREPFPIVRFDER
jgi:hypothetical protein